MNHLNMRCLIEIVFLIAGCSFVQCTKNDPVDNHDDTVPVSFENGVRLTDNIADILPKWSLFGQKIAFERNGNIYVIDVQSQVLSFETAGHSPFWSPGGDQIGYIKGGEIYTIRMVTGRPVTKLTLGAYASERGGGDWNAADRIVYFQEGDSASQGRKLMVYDILTDTYQWKQTEPLGYAELPGWSPEGRYILFSSPLLGICLFDNWEDQLKHLSQWGMPGKPCWYYPDILFVENGQLFSMNINGENRIRLYSDSFFIGSMDHSFDREQITFSCQGIWIMDFPPGNDGYHPIHSDFYDL
jgi:hypothetical protein